LKLSIRGLVVPAIGVVLSLVFTQFTFDYQYGVFFAFPQVGIFLAAGSGGVLWGLLAAGLGGLVLYYQFGGYLWLATLVAMGLVAGLLASRMRIALASILSWLTAGVVVTYVIFYNSNQAAHVLNPWLMAVSYEVAIGAVVADVVLTLLHISRKKSKVEKQAVRSEAQVELGL
jgi:hypothetical protein